MCCFWVCSNENFTLFSTPTDETEIKFFGYTLRGKIYFFVPIKLLLIILAIGDGKHYFLGLVNSYCKTEMEIQSTILGSVKPYSVKIKQRLHPVVLRTLSMFLDMLAIQNLGWFRCTVPPAEDEIRKIYLEQIPEMKGPDNYKSIQSSDDWRTAASSRTERMSIVDIDILKITLCS